MPVRAPLASALCRFLPFALALASLPGFAQPGFAQAEDDASLCLVTAERVDAGETLTDAERQEAHEACRRALAATASVVQKYQFQEADFAITGKRDTY